MAPTCNCDDGPCHVGMIYFGNQVCNNSSAKGLSSAVEVINGGNGPCPTDKFCYSNVVCKSRIQSQCDYVLSVEIDILPCTTTGVSDQHRVKVGDLCTGTGRCGTDPELNNCRSTINDQDIYIHLGPSECIQHDLVGGGGVISSSENADNESGGGNYTGDAGLHLQLLNTTSIGLKDSETV